MAREYMPVVIQFKGKHRAIICHRSEKCSALVAITNFSLLGQTGVNPANPPQPSDPQDLTEELVDTLKEIINELPPRTTLYNQVNGKEEILEKIARSLDSPTALDPVNTSCFEFTQTDELLLLNTLEVPLLHGWILDKKDKHLDFVKGVSHSNFHTKIAEAEQSNSSDALRKELNDFMNARITTYGLSCLHEAVEEGELAILYDNNGYHVLHKHDGDLFTLEATEEIVTRLPNAVWKKLSIEEKKSFHVTSSFTPTNGQPKENQELADEWMLTALDNKPTTKKKKKKKKPKPKPKVKRKLTTETIAQDTELEVKLLIRLSKIKSDDHVSPWAYLEVSRSPSDLSSQMVNPQLLDLKQFLEKKDFHVECSTDDLADEDNCIVISKIIKAEERKIVVQGPVCEEFITIFSPLHSWLSVVTK